MTQNNEETALKHELNYYKENKDDWLEKYGEGKFIVIKEDQVIGPYDDREKAYEEGLNEFGLKPFLVQRVSKEEQVDHLPALELGIIHAS